MKFNVLRDLTNKVFTSTIARVVVQDDPDNLVETKLENDFGPVKIEAGQIFEGFITKDSTTGELNVSLTGTIGPGVIKLKFATPSNSIAITSTSQIVFKCDANLQAPIVFDATTTIPSLKVAELKCKLFELGIQDRIEKAVVDWKAEQTTFEDTEPAGSFDVSLQ
jgi:hypothetical protein